MDLNKLKKHGDKKSKFPDMSGITSGLSASDCKRTPEYGSPQDDQEFDAIHDYDLSDVEIESMTVLSGTILDGILITYANGLSVRHGGNGGTGSQFSLQGDSIKRVTGVCNVNFGGHRVISQLIVETANGKKYGPFGADKNGSPFTIEGNGERIIAFFGSMDGAYIASLGGYLMK